VFALERLRSPLDCRANRTGVLRAKAQGGEHKARSYIYVCARLFLPNATKNPRANGSRVLNWKSRLRFDEFGFLGALSRCRDGFVGVADFDAHGLGHVAVQAKRDFVEAFGANRVLQ